MESKKERTPYQKMFTIQVVQAFLIAIIAVNVIIADVIAVYLAKELISNNDTVPAQIEDLPTDWPSPEVSP